MTRLKRIILRVSVFLLLFLLVATVLSRTVYWLMLPQVTVVKVQPGMVNNSRAYKTVIMEADAGEARENGGPDAAQPEYAAELSLTFDELKTLYSVETVLQAAAESLTDKAAVPVDISLSGYTYDSAADRFITRFSVSDADSAVEAGFPLTITVRQAVRDSMLIPLGGLYMDDSNGYYVYGIEQTRTMWGTETRVRKKTIAYVGSDDRYAGVIFLPNEGASLVACYPSRPISDGDTVKVAP
jgi:hypothetical protein